MKITFTIADCTTLCGKREQSIQVSDLDCTSDCMEFASKLTENVKKFTSEYVNKQQEGQQ